MSGNIKRIVVLGVTGSIGQQTLDVVRRHPEKLQIVGLACGKRVSTMLEAAAEFGVSVCATSSVEAATAARDAGMVSAKTTLEAGTEAVLDLVRMTEADLVVNALVGAAGLQASYETLRAGKVLALANKESLVVGGELLCSAVLANSGQVDAAASAGTQSASALAGLRSEVRGAGASETISRTSETLADSRATGESSISCLHPNSLIRPIDSEHGAIWQCLLGEDEREVAALWVTASGGPFRGKTREELTNVTPEAALAHPTWNMGPKITIDSSTLMNKGLEVIEAHHLFNMPYDKIRVVVQPQSAIHSMVEFSDGSMKAHLGTTDMRIPIQFALSYPHRWDAPVPPLDFCALGSLEFAAPDTDTFRCLALARAAGEAGGTLPCAMNAANEVAVAAFLEKRLGYLGIADCVEAVMNAHSGEKVTSIEQLLEVDAWARKEAEQYISWT